MPSAPKRLKLVQVFSIPGVGSTSNTSMAQKHCPTVQVNKDPVIPGLKQQSLALTDSVTLDSKQATSVSQNLNDSVDLAIKEQSASKLVKDSFSCESKQSEQNSEIVKDLKYSEPIQTESAFQAVKDMKKLGSKSTPISEELVEDTTQLAPKQTTVVQKSKDPVTTALQKMNILKNNNIKSQNVSKNEILHRNSITESESSALLETAEGNNMDDKEVAPPGSLKKTGNLSQHDQSKNKTEKITVTCGKTSFMVPISNLNNPAKSAPRLVREINLGQNKEAKQMTEVPEKMTTLKPHFVSSSSKNNLTSGQDELSNSNPNLVSPVNTTFCSPSEDNFLTTAGGVYIYTNDHLKKITNQCIKNNKIKQNQTVAVATPSGVASSHSVNTIKNVQSNLLPENIVETIKNQLIENRNKKILSGIRMSPLPSNLTKIINGELQMHFKRQEASSTVTVGTQANLELPSTSLQTTTSTVCSPTITACQSNSDIFIQGNNTQEKMRTVQQPQGNVSHSRSPQFNFRPVQHQLRTSMPSQQNPFVTYRPRLANLSLVPATTRLPAMLTGNVPSPTQNMSTPQTYLSWPASGQQQNVNTRPVSFQQHGSASSQLQQAIMAFQNIRNTSNDFHQQSQPQAATHSAYNKQAQQQQPITQTIVNTRMPFPQQVVSSVNATHPVTRPSVAVTVVATPTQQENKAPVYEAELLQGYYQ